jgi:hypothetical protein
MENGCPVLPKKIRVSTQATHVDALLVRAKRIAEEVAQTDAELAVSFMNNVEHLKSLGDPMLEWFIACRETNLTDKEKAPLEKDAGDFYSF